MHCEIAIQLQAKAGAYGFRAIPQMTWKTSASWLSFALTATGTCRCSLRQYTSGWTSCRCKVCFKILLGDDSVTTRYESVAYLLGQIKIGFCGDEKCGYVIKAVLLLKMREVSQMLISLL